MAGAPPLDGFVMRLHPGSGGPQAARPGHLDQPCRSALNRDFRPLAIMEDHQLDAPGKLSHRGASLPARPPSPPRGRPSKVRRRGSPGSEPGQQLAGIAAEGAQAGIDKLQLPAPPRRPGPWGTIRHESTPVGLVAVRSGLAGSTRAAASFVGHTYTSLRPATRDLLLGRSKETCR
jgi:hypothetical protein